MPFDHRKLAFKISLAYPFLFSPAHLLPGGGTENILVVNMLKCRLPLSSVGQANKFYSSSIWRSFGHKVFLVLQSEVLHGHEKCVWETPFFACNSSTTNIIHLQCE